MIEYLEPKEFKERYPLGEEISHGGQAHVYESKNYAIKKFKAINPFELMGELNFYSLCNHPCIMKPQSYTFDKIGYIAMPLGINIIGAYKHRLISIEEIISDALSAINYMASIGIVHNDIKVSNLVYYKGKATFIDMGLSRKIKKQERFPSPEGTLPNELWILKRAYLKIFCMDNILKDYKTEIEHIDWLSDKIEHEIPLNEILTAAPKELILRTHKGISKKQISCNKPPTQEIIELQICFDLRDQIVIEMTDLFHRCIDKCPTGDRKLLAYVCMKMISYLFNLSGLISFKCQKFDTDIPDQHQMVIDIMRFCDCKILFTAK